MTDWSQVVQEHGPLVWRAVRRLLSREADAADCFQRTFLAALELSRAGPVHNWPGLLRRLAVARAMDRLRERYRDAGRLAPLTDGACIDRRAVDPAEAAAAGELAEHLRAALADLDPVQAQVFYLACVEDCPYRQIAEELSLTVNHVGVLLNRARAALRRRLQAHQPAAGTADRRREE